MDISTELLREASLDALRAYREVNPDYCPRCAGTDEHLSPRIIYPSDGSVPCCCPNDPRSVGARSVWARRYANG